jgi:hypothetical protein
MMRSAGRYCVKIPFRGFLSKFETTSWGVTFPAGETLQRRAVHSGALLGMAHVIWQGREYSVFERDLSQNCERVEGTAAGSR